MRKIGLIQALRTVHKAEKMTVEERTMLQQKRLNELVMYARNNSPYFEKLYHNISEQFTLSDLPVTKKVEMLDAFDDWVTDRTISFVKVNHFMENLDNIGRKLDGKYLVNTTSGSTGNPCVVLYDNRMSNVMDAIGGMRTFARKEDMKAYIKAGGRSFGLYADEGFYLGCGSIRRKLLMMPWKKKQLGIIDVRKPTQEIVDALNLFQPALLGGYPTALELLIPEQKSGNLHISPVIINTGGEYLSEEVRQELGNAFGCYVQTNYGCTEGGTMANECRAHHFHVNDDWIIIEPVDENNRPVPYGQQSEKILVTNLANYIQPIIRFEVTDRVVMHQEGCRCGKSGVWLEIEGRSDDILTFANGKKIAPLGIYALLKEIHCIKRFQVLQTDKNVLTLRIVAQDKEGVFLNAKQVLMDYLVQNGVMAEILLSQEEPKANQKNGKFKHIIALKTMRSASNISD